ncbi:MAG TPA: hypothetical protein VE011_04900 [Candidatus Dormibacteraeota bacterium]|nr:hypothetical protein [Candidatus Dormibacteraeota bacterium]
MNTIECAARPPDVTACADLRDQFAPYAYLLGIYLGDGCLTLAHGNVWRLRISQDASYPKIIEQIEQAITEVASRHPGRIRRQGCFEIYSNWKHWLCVFPQHAPGPKHLRAIKLTPWQKEIVAAEPSELIRGLIHSDGCRTINRVTRSWSNTVRTYEYPRYFFANHSAEIRGLFIETCGQIGVEARHNNRYSVSVARRPSVEILESIIGMKR